MRAYPILYWCYAFWLSPTISRAMEPTTCSASGMYDRTCPTQPLLQEATSEYVGAMTSNRDIHRKHMYDWMHRSNLEIWIYMRKTSRMSDALACYELYIWIFPSLECQSSSFWYY
ncbi:unnamed protein product [Musa hybrid cultivar]